jgi:hypothetical protein
MSAPEEASWKLELSQAKAIADARSDSPSNRNCSPLPAAHTKKPGSRLTAGGIQFRGPNQLRLDLAGRWTSEIGPHGSIFANSID